MKHSDRSQLFASDIEQIAGVSRTKATAMIREFGGCKDVAGRWVIDTRTFDSCYNPLVRAFVTGGGDYMITIEKIITAVRELAGEGGAVSFKCVRKANRPNWFIRIHGSGQREKLISLGTADKQIAQQIEAEIRSRFHALAVSGIVPYNTRQFFDEWLSGKEAEIAPGSYKRYRAVVDKALPFMPPELHQISIAHIERFKDWLLRERYQARSIILELNTLNTIFRKAVRLGYMKYNPVQDISKPRKPQTDVVPYMDGELDTIFTELHRRAEAGLRGQCTEAWTAYTEILYCLLYTGLRISDALDLKWESVSLRFSTIRLRQQKTNREAIIRIPTPFKERLQALADTGRRGEFVYCNTMGKPVTYTRIDHAMRQVISACGIEKKSPLHSFRHTAAVRMLSAGIPIFEVAAQLGDTVETVVRNYVKPNMPDQTRIDVAFRQPACSRNVPVGLGETAVFGTFNELTEQHHKEQKSPKNKGFLAETIEPKTYCTSV